MEPIILAESVNPSGTFRAIVEQTDKNIYFYIQPHGDLAEQFPMRSSWVRNLVAAPAEFDYESMQAGEAPLLPAANCAHPEGSDPLEEERLTLVWFAAEDGASLLYDEEVIAIIPGWSLYMENPVSYAKECIAETNTLFPLESGNILIEETYKSLEYIDQWTEDSSPWPTTQEYILSSYEKVFGPHHQYFAIDGGTWPPMALVSFKYEDLYVFLSVGISQRPMPWVDFLYSESATAYRRMELGIAVHQSAGEGFAMELAQGIAGLAGMPWRKISWLGEGHTISSNAVKAPYESLILSSALYNGPALPALEMGADKVNIYWAQPITLAEREFVHEQSNERYALVEKLINADVNWVVTGNRKPVV
jgi:hypothetical protein